MTVTTNFFQQPRLRDGVVLAPLGEAYVIQYRDQEYELEFDADTRESSIRFLESLRTGGRTIDALERDLPDIKDQIGELCRDLDRLGVLTESAPGTVEAKTGAQLHRELLRFVERAKRTYPARPLHAALEDGSITREQLIGYALEYFHIVRMCPALLAPSLTHHESRRTRDVLQNFFVSELNHDQLIERSLATVGIDRAQIDRMIPLPMTFAVCAALGVHARQHPLSFKAALFLFEEPDGSFNAKFQRACEAKGLPAGFWGPILEHASINEEGEHDSITKLLLDDVPCVAPEEELVVKRHVGSLVESIVRMEQQIVDYYGERGSVIPRCFE